MDLIWDGGSLSIAGPDTGPVLARTRAGTTYTAIRFAPGIGPSVFGMPAHAARNQRVALQEVWEPHDVARLVEQIQDGGDVGRMLEAVSGGRLREAPTDPLPAEVVRLIGVGLPIADVAATVGLSERQLHRRSLVAFGYGAKMLARILRLQRALGLARTGSSFASTAAVAGYADQAHLARESRALAGATWGALVR